MGDSTALPDSFQARRAAVIKPGVSTQPLIHISPHRLGKSGKRTRQWAPKEPRHVAWGASPASYTHLVSGASVACDLTLGPSPEGEGGPCRTGEARRVRCAHQE